MGNGYRRQNLQCHQVFIPGLSTHCFLFHYMDIQNTSWIVSYLWENNPICIWRTKEGKTYIYINKCGGGEIHPNTNSCLSWWSNWKQFLVFIQYFFIFSTHFTISITVFCFEQLEVKKHQNFNGQGVLLYILQTAKTLWELSTKEKRLNLWSGPRIHKIIYNQD